MNQDGLPSRNEASSESCDESEVARVFDAYLADLEAGRPVDPARLLADHPDIAEQLRACLEVMSLADQVANGSGAATPEPRSAVDASASPSARGTSLITTLELDLGPAGMPQILLRELPDEPEPVARPRSTEMPPSGAGGNRYQLQGEIARGGMGAILKGRDVDLGRDLAIKVLLESHQRNPEVVRRFVEEAQIGGQLQHPGIVPVYELGAFADRRPYFAMKLVKGQTLASLLAERNDRVGRGAPDSPRASGERVAEGPVRGSGLPSTHDDLPRFLSIFEAVCQTIAYAHARGVIHRDLKPTNVMVGSFGEVQVMDWGLAKVLPQGGVADEGKSQPIHETIIMTVRSGSESQAGSVLGTPAYMAPEQARGEIDRVDERADVLGLGAILCEILTGQPPFVGASREEIRAQAARGDLADALDRLETCGADAELIELARICLRPERDQRPRNAGEVAGRITAHLVGVQERLKAAELGRVEAQTRAEEAQARAVIERSRQRRTVALAGSVLLIAGLAGGGWAYLVRQWQTRAVLFNRALGEAEGAYTEAQRVGDDPSRWLAARDAAHALEGLLADAPDRQTRRRVSDFVQRVTVDWNAAQNDQKLLAQLVDIRSAKGDDRDASITDAAYANAFRDFGIDIDAISAHEAGVKILARPAPVAAALVGSLDDWASTRRLAHPKAREPWERVIAAARAADLDPLRDRLRALWLTPDRKTERDSLRKLAQEADPEKWPPQSLLLLAAALSDSGDPDAAVRVLYRVQAVHPGDVWVNHTLGLMLEKLSRREEAIRFYTAARAIRPGTAHELAHALAARGQSDEAIAVFRDLARLRPGDVRHLSCLGRALKEKGLPSESLRALEAASAAGREKVRLRGDDALAHASLGDALSAQNKYDEAIAEYRMAVRIKPDLTDAYNNLGNALDLQHKSDDAIAAYRTAIHIRPDDADVHLNLGVALENQGKLDEAIAEYRTAIRLKSDEGVAHNNLAFVLGKQGKLDEAIAEYRTAISLRPDFAGAHDDLGVVLAKQGKLDEAITEYRTTLRLNPDLAEAHCNLGDALENQGKVDEAVTEYRTAIRLEPDLPEAHHNLGRALVKQGKRDEAIAGYRTAIRLNPDHPATHNSLGVLLANQGRLDEAITENRTAIRLNPDYAEAHCDLGNILLQKGDFAGALQMLRKGHELGSRRPDWRFPSAAWIVEAERVLALSKRLPAVLQGKDRPGDNTERLTLAQMAYNRRKFVAATTMWAEALENNPKVADDRQAQHRYNSACAAALAAAGKGQDEPPLDEGAKVHWRKQAVDWLKSELAIWNKLLETGTPQAGQAVAQALQHWKEDFDLVSIRDRAALAKLPDQERKDCQALWAEVDALLAKARAGAKP
jgi:serine/threonine-protein kinase